MKKLYFTLFAVFVAGFIVWAMLYQSGAIGSGVKTPPGERAAEAAADAHWKKLEPTAMPTFFTAVGTIRSREEVDVISRLFTARVTEVGFRGGEHFKAGDVIVKLEDRDLKAKVDAASENLKGAESRLAFAKSEYDRNAKLVESRAVAPRAFEEASSNLNAAKAEVAMMRHELENAKTNFEYATIRAPFDGVVAERDCEPGDLATPLNPLMKLFNPAKLKLQVPIRETLYRDVKIGDVLRVKVEATGKSYSATIKEIVPSVDAGSRSFIINAYIDGETPELMPGMFAVCEIPTGEQKVLAVPERAVMKIGQLEYLRIRTAGGAADQLVKTVPLANGMVEIVSGAAAGDEYLDDPS
ncbi:MAG: efflux RND transporter periplasmic adaptor subunit [Victivallaceae bacterium]